MLWNTWMAGLMFLSIMPGFSIPILLPRMATTGWKAGTARCKSILPHRRSFVGWRCFISKIAGAIMTVVTEAAGSSISPAALPIAVTGRTIGIMLHQKAAWLR